MNINIKTKVLIKYRHLIKLAGKIDWYNYRDHTLRKLRHDFMKGKQDLNQMDNYHQQLKRIVTIQNMYSTNERIIEKKYSEH